MESIHTYKITFDFDDGYSLWNNAIEHVTASSENKAEKALRNYMDGIYSGTALIERIHSIEQIPIIDGAILTNETHIQYMG